MHAASTHSIWVPPSLVPPPPSARVPVACASIVLPLTLLRFTVCPGCPHLIAVQYYFAGDQLHKMKFYQFSHMKRILRDDIYREFAVKVSSNSGGWSRRKWDLRPDGCCSPPSNAPLALSSVCVFPLAACVASCLKTKSVEGIVIF